MKEFYEYDGAKTVWRYIDCADQFFCGRTGPLGE